MSDGLVLGRRRLASLATVIALTMAVTIVGSASAGSTPVRVKSAEKYALNLLNCTRTGGWVRENGTCAARGSGKHSSWRAPLRRHRVLGSKVAWPWAKALVIADVCGHVIPGKAPLTKRMWRSGFRGGYWGENVGCSWGGSPKDAVLMTHRMMQAEKPYRGGHWRNIKNGRFKIVGIGVATRNGRTMVVWDFYGR
jgi:hypothetical protein